MDRFSGSDKEILQELVIVVELLKEQISALKEALKSLMETVQIGNGKHSLLTRAALIEEEVENLKQRQDQIEDNKKDDTKNLESKEKSTTFVDSKTGKKTFKKSGKSKIINIEDEDVDNKDIDDAIKKCK